MKKINFLLAVILISITSCSTETKSDIPTEDSNSLNPTEKYHDPNVVHITINSNGHTYDVLDAYGKMSVSHSPKCECYNDSTKNKK